MSNERLRIPPAEALRLLVLDNLNRVQIVPQDVLFENPTYTSQGVEYNHRSHDWGEKRVRVESGKASMDLTGVELSGDDFSFKGEGFMDMDKIDPFHAASIRLGALVLDPRMILSNLKEPKVNEKGELVGNLYPSDIFMVGEKEIRDEVASHEVRFLRSDIEADIKYYSNPDEDINWKRELLELNDEELVEAQITEQLSPAEASIELNGEGLPSRIFLAGTGRNKDPFGVPGFEPLEFKYSSK